MLLIRMLSARTSVRNRVKALPSPWMTTGQALESEPAAMEGSMLLDGLQGVIRTGGVKAATASRCQGMECRREQIAIEVQQRENQPTGQQFQNITASPEYIHSVSRVRAPIAPLNLRSTSFCPAFKMDRRATQTISHDSGSISWFKRKVSLSNRLARFRSTAFPTRRDAITPIRRSGGARSGRALKLREKKPHSRRIPMERRVSNSRAVRKCCCRVYRITAARAVSHSVYAVHGLDGL